MLKRTVFFKDFFFFWCGSFLVFIEFVTILLLFCVLVLWPWGMWNLSSLTRDWTWTPCNWKAKSPPLDHQGCPKRPLDCLEKVGLGENGPFWVNEKIPDLGVLPLTDHLKVGESPTKRRARLTKALQLPPSNKQQDSNLLWQFFSPCKERDNNSLVSIFMKINVITALSFHICFLYELQPQNLCCAGFMEKQMTFMHNEVPILLICLVEAKSPRYSNHS